MMKITVAKNFVVLSMAFMLISCASEKSVTKPSAEKSALENTKEKPLEKNPPTHNAGENVTANTANSEKPAEPEISAKLENKLEFYDSEVFDGKLGVALMADQPRVEVAIVSPFSVNEIPKKMGAWLVAVNDHGGTVTMQSDPAYPKERGFIAEIVDLISLAYDAAKKGAIYGAAEKYNFVMFYKQGGVVTKVVFQHK